MQKNIYSVISTYCDRCAGLFNKPRSGSNPPPIKGRDLEGGDVSPGFKSLQKIVEDVFK